MLSPHVLAIKFFRQISCSRCSPAHGRPERSPVVPDNFPLQALLVYRAVGRTFRRTFFAHLIRSFSGRLSGRSERPGVITTISSQTTISFRVRQVRSSAPKCAQVRPNASKCAHVNKLRKKSLAACGVRQLSWVTQAQDGMVHEGARSF